MRKNLTGKTVLIAAILLVFIFGIFGIPHGLGGQALKDALAKRISLGLDLKGGTHLVLQVMVDEAVGAETDNALGRLQSDLQAAGISVGSIVKPNPVGPADPPDLRRTRGQVRGRTQPAGYEVWPAVQHQLDPGWLHADLEAERAAGSGEKDAAAID